MDENNPQFNPVTGQQQAEDVARAKLEAAYRQLGQSAQNDSLTQNHQPQSIPLPPSNFQSPIQQSSQQDFLPHHQQSAAGQDTRQVNHPTSSVVPHKSRGEKVIQPPASNSHPQAQSPTITELYNQEQTLQAEAEHLRQTPASPDHQLPNHGDAFVLPGQTHAAHYQLEQQSSHSSHAEHPPAFSLPGNTTPTPQINVNVQASQPSRQEAIANFSQQKSPTSKPGQIWATINSKWDHFINGDDITPGHGKALRNAAIVSLALIFFYNHQFVYGQVQSYISPGNNVTSPSIIEATEAKPDPKSKKIIIPKINVDVPVVYDITSWEDADVQKGLERGVVHYGTTAVPGEKGNNVIVGHSSNSVWNSGEYKFAFVLLDRLENGDTFILEFEGERYIYEVFNKEVIEPTNVSVINQDIGDTPITTLITCTPPGTAWRRLIVQAKQISPNPAEAKAATATEPIPDQAIPGDTGSQTLFESISNLFN